MEKECKTNTEKNKWKKQDDIMNEITVENMIQLGWILLFCGFFLSFGGMIRYSWNEGKLTKFMDYMTGTAILIGATLIMLGYVLNGTI